ncbi:MAG: hypothetical protein QM754_03735 [Tepidisphaeraceae bacterium]
MCQTADPISHVRIIRCEHGTSYVTLGNVTLALSDHELVLIDQAIHKLARHHPRLQRELLQALCANNAPEPEEEPA